MRGVREDLRQEKLAVRRVVAAALASSGTKKKRDEE